MSTKVYVERYQHLCLWCGREWVSQLARPSVCPTCHRLNWDRPRRRPSPRRSLPRYRRVLEAYESGTPAVEIARQEGLARQSIYRILTRAARMREQGLL